jgi:hypothetical protein
MKVLKFVGREMDTITTIAAPTKAKVPNMRRERYASELGFSPSEWFANATMK